MAGTAILAGLAGWGLWRGWPGRRLVLVLALAWVAVLIALLAGPQRAPLAAGGVQGWVLLGAVLALVLGYRAVLSVLHERAATMVPDQPAATAGSAPLSGVELDRYARHIVLRELGGPGQRKLQAARVLVVGAGALGAPVCAYLAAAGVGRITVADDDRVSLSNLQRQVLFRDDDLGRPKAATVAAAMKALNPHIAVTPLPRRITEGDAALIAEHDLVLDGTDSFESRAAINRACVEAGTPLIAGSIAQWEGQITIWDPARGAPCMACLFPQAPAAGLAPSCAEAGVVGALPGVVGSMMALEAIKLIAGAGQPMRGRMMVFDGLWGETRTLNISRNPDCPVCASVISPDR